MPVCREKVQTYSRCVLSDSKEKMKTSEGVMILCVLAAVTLSCESARQWLNSINDLKKIDFERSVPKHSLLLLHWFANNINIDQYNSITLNFDPTSDFGSHHYGNFQGMLDPLPQGYSYYTVGNLNEDFPAYVRNPSVRSYEGRNRDRIIFSAQRNYRISRVFLTQHEGQSTSSNYDQHHTYEISPNLLREIRPLSENTLLNITQPSYPINLQSRRNGGSCDCFLICIILIIMFIIFLSFLATNK